MPTIYENVYEKKGAVICRIMHKGTKYEKRFRFSTPEARRVAVKRALAWREEMYSQLNEYAVGDQGNSAWAKLCPFVRQKRVPSQLDGWIKETLTRTNGEQLWKQ